MTEAFATDLIVRDGRVHGVLARHADGGWIFHRASHVVLATGGVGSVFLHTTNPAENTGDGLAMAARAGAALGDLEFVQFHPTALAADDGSGRPLPLLTEALRGAGAVMLDGQGRRFMPDEHPDAELAPRDIVARAVWRRVAAGERVTLDMRSALAEDAGHFPTVLDLCAQAGIDPTREPVPIAPAAHYHMGGVVTDADGRTSIDGLWACGEVANTGVHGANRLASNSLLEALVFGDRVARAITAAGAGGKRSPIAIPDDSGGARWQWRSRRRDARSPPPRDVRPCRAVARRRRPGSGAHAPGRAGSGTHPPWHGRASRPSPTPSPGVNCATCS